MSIIEVMRKRGPVGPVSTMVGEMQNQQLETIHIPLHDEGMVLEVRIRRMEDVVTENLER